MRRIYTVGQGQTMANIPAWSHQPTACHFCILLSLCDQDVPGLHWILVILQVLVVGREYAHAFILLPLCGEVKLHSYKISTCNLAQQVSHCRVFSYMSCIFDIQPDQPGEHKSYYEKHSRIAIRLAQHSRACYHRLWPSISDAEPGQGKHLNPLIDFDRGMTNPHRCAMVCLIIHHRGVAVAVTPTWWRDSTTAMVHISSCHFLCMIRYAWVAWYAQPKLAIEHYWNFVLLDAVVGRGEAGKLQSSRAEGLVDRAFGQVRRAFHCNVIFLALGTLAATWEGHRRTFGFTNAAMAYHGILLPGHLGVF